MKRLALLAGALLAGCATVSPQRVSRVEKRLSYLEGKVRELDQDVNNLESRIVALEKNYKLLYDEFNRIRKEEGLRPLPKRK